MARLFIQQLSERIATLPGVESSWSKLRNFHCGNPEGVITIEQSKPDDSGSARIPFPTRDEVSESFFQTMHVPLRQGRFFDYTRHCWISAVAIVNETMQRRFWPGEQAIGKRFKVGLAQSSNPWLTGNRRCR
jgi:putative ABC transport system permease protein